MKNSIAQSGWRAFLPSKFVWILPLVFVLALYGWAQLGTALNLQSTLMPGMGAENVAPSPYPLWVVTGYGIVWILLVLAYGFLLLPLLIPFCFVIGPTLHPTTELYPVLLFLGKTMVLYLFVQLPLQFLHFALRPKSAI